MSISNRHTVVPFVAGKTAPMTDQRLAKVGYKKTTKLPNPLPSIAVSIPVLELTQDHYTRAASYIRTLFEDAQDGIIRSLNDSSGGTLKEVSDDEISPDSCLAFLEAEANGSRLSKELIETWFDVEMTDRVEILIAQKLKYSLDNDLTADQRKTLKPMIAGVREIFSALAGGKTLLSQGKINGCRYYLNGASEDDETAQRLELRLVAMEKRIAEQAAKDAQMLDALGFADAPM